MVECSWLWFEPNCSLLNWCVSLLAPECAMCLCVYVCVFVCVSKKPHCIADLTKHDALLHKTSIKVFLVLRSKAPRLDMCRSIISLSKIVHQMWHDHPFSQRKNRWWGLEVTRNTVGGRGVDKI